MKGSVNRFGPRKCQQYQFPTKVVDNTRRMHRLSQFNYNMYHYQLKLFNNQLEICIISINDTSLLLKQMNN